MKHTSLTTAAALALAIAAAPSAVLADIPDHEDTFLAPGLLQGRLPGQYNIEDSLWDSDTAIRRELGPGMGLITDRGGYLYNNPTYYQSPIDAVRTAWTNDVTFVYEGRIYLDSSKLYVFGSRIDDSARMLIDGDAVYGYGTGGGCHLAAYAPAYTGWHPVEIRCGNGGGWAGANPYCNVGRIGFCYFAVDADSPEAATYAAHRTDNCDDIDNALWQTLIDDGTGNLFGTSPHTGPIDAVKVQYIGVAGGSLYATILPEIKEEVNVYAWFGPDYGGTNRDSWAHEQWVGRTDGSGTMSVTADFGLQGASYVRFIASGYRDGTHKWAGATYAVADIPSVEFDPQVTCSRDASTATPFSVNMVVDVAYPGYGASDWTATLVYGPGPRDTATVSGTGAGQQTISVTNLMGGYSYAGTLTVTTDTERTVTISNVDVSAAAEPSLGLLPGLMQGRLDGIRNLTDGLDASTTDVRRELGPVMGLFTDTTGVGSYTSELDGVKSYWTQQVTYLYQGQIYLDASKEYAFGARNDDSCDIMIDGAVVIERGNCAHTAAPYIPSYTGWHSIDIRSGNNGGWAGANPYCPIGYKGIVYNDEGNCDHTCSNSHVDEDWWWPLKDAGDGALLGTPGVTAKNDLAIVAATNSLGGVTAWLDVSIPDSVTIYAWTGATYGGIVAEDWDSTSAALASRPVSGGAQVVRVHAPVSAGAQYVRFYAVSDRDPSIVWTSPTIPLATLPKAGGLVLYLR